MKHTERLKKRKARETRTRVVAVLSAIVVFIATYALVLPAITMDVSTAQNASGFVLERTPASQLAGIPVASVRSASEEDEEVAAEADTEEIASEIQAAAEEEADAKAEEEAKAKAEEEAKAKAEEEAKAKAEEEAKAKAEEEAKAKAEEEAKAKAEEEAKAKAEEEAKAKAEEEAKAKAEEEAKAQAADEEVKAEAEEKEENAEEAKAEEEKENQKEELTEQDNEKEAEAQDNKETEEKDEADSKDAEEAEDGSDTKEAEENANTNTEDASLTEENAEEAEADAEAAAVAATEEAAIGATEEAAAEFAEPELAPVSFDEILTDKTGFYYYHPENEEGLEGLTSNNITDWKKVHHDTVLAPEDFVRAYLAYTIPAGALNSTNATARYRLPKGLELTDAQIESINKNKNGFSSSMRNDAEKEKYLGAEAVEGTRTPDEQLKEGEGEFISATVKVEKVFDKEDKDKVIGQDLVFTFVPYTVNKNAIAYDAKGNKTYAGEEIKGYFNIDFLTSQIDFKETETIIEKTEGTLSDTETAEETTADTAEGVEEDVPENNGGIAAVRHIFSEAEIVFAKKDAERHIDEISRTLTLKEDENFILQETDDTDQEEKGIDASETEVDASETDAADADPEEEDAAAWDDVLMNLHYEGADYVVDITYGNDANIPENAELAVREIQKGTEEYNYYLQQAQGAVEENREVNSARFFDITILVDGSEIEPEAPVSVQINFTGIYQKNTDDTQLIHYTEEEAQVLDQAEFSKTEETVDTVQFETDAFSVYGIVGTEMIVTEWTLQTPDGEDVTYIVTLTYGKAADIPEGSEIKITEFDRESPEYLAAQEAVVSMKLQEDSDFDQNAFGMAAFDISIFDLEGQEIEPKASVDLSIRMKQLPEEFIVAGLQDSLEIHHLDTSKEELVVNTVASVADGSIQTNDDTAEAEFHLSSFSTFTLDWNSRGNNYASTTVRVFYPNSTSGGGGRSFFGATFKDENGNNFSRPEPIGNTVDYTNLAALGELTIDLDSRFDLTVPNYTYVGTFVDVNGTSQKVTSAKITRQNGTTTLTYFNGSEEVLSASSTHTDTERHDFNEDGMALSIIYENNNHTTVHYGYVENGEFIEFDDPPVPTNTSTSDGWAYLIYDFEGKDSEGRRFEYNFANTYYHTAEVDGDPRTGGTEVAPVLRFRDNNWKYYATEHGYSGTALRTDGNWTNASAGSHIYMVYEKPHIEMGGAPIASETGEEPKAPDILKQSEDNGDGTNTLSLNIVGSTEDLVVEKLADVIVVLDLSSSMQNNINNSSSTGSGYATNSNSRFYMAMEAVDTLANNLYTKNTDDKKMIRMGLITFAGDAQVRQPLTDDKNEFLGTLGNITRYEGKGTNWEQALKLANEMELDPERATFVVFVTDGEPTTCQTRHEVTNANIGSNNYILRPGTSGGGVPTDYTWTSNNQHNQSYPPMYFYLNSGTFGSTNAGAPNSLPTESGNLSGSTLYNNAAHDDAKSIVDHNKNFYVIAISRDVGVNSLNNLMSAAGVPSDHGIPATNQQALKDAFDKIESEITGMLGWGEIKMTDGMTDLSNTVMESSSLLGVDDDFTYYKADAPASWNDWTDEEKAAYVKGIDFIDKIDTPPDYDSMSDKEKAAFAVGKEANFEPWDPTTEKCELASFNESTEAVEWNMGNRFMLEDGCTYRVSFTVWPSQEAYDWIANLNNGTRTWDDVVAAGINCAYGETPAGDNPQIVNNGDGTYSLKTNRPGANTTYKTATKTGTTISTSGNPYTLEFNDVGPMPLVPEKMVLQKEWEHDINKQHMPTSLKFWLLSGNLNDQGNWVFGYYQNDGTIKPTTDDAKEIEVSENTNPKWRNSIEIAPGLGKVQDGNVIKTLETGHKYKLEEFDLMEGEELSEYAESYEFKSQTVRPMVLDKWYPNVAYFVLIDADNPKPDGKDVYYLDGEQYYLTFVTDKENPEEDQGIISGTNYRKSELDITKIIDDQRIGKMTEYQQNNETFTYKVTLEVPKDANLSLITCWEYVYNPGNPNTKVDGYQIEEGDHPISGDEELSGTKHRWGTISYGNDDSGKGIPIAQGFSDPEGETRKLVMYVSLKQREVLRFTNLPTGTEYWIEEVYANYRKAGLSRNVDAPENAPGNDMPSNLAEQGYTQVTYKQKTVGKEEGAETPATEGTVAHGKITEPNARYYNQFTNILTKEYAVVNFEDVKKLAGYEWSKERYFFSVEGYDETVMPPTLQDAFYISKESGPESQSYRYGDIRFIKEGVYKFKITEAPVTDPRYTPTNAKYALEGVTGYGEEKIITVTVEKNGDEYFVTNAEDDKGNTVLSDDHSLITTTFTNTVATEVKLLKLGDNNTENPLSNVQFKLYSDEECTEANQIKIDSLGNRIGDENGIVTTDQNGIASLEKLTAGTYYVDEIVTHDGYNLLAGPLKIILSLNNTQTPTEPYRTKYVVTGKIIQKDFNAAAPTDPNADGYFVVNNTSGVELPHTGGPGTFLYTLSGIALIVASVIMYGFRMRRRERRLN